MTGTTTRDGSLQDLLFAELHHRFYNSLQVISALASRLGRPELSIEEQRLTAGAIQSRVVVLADLHRLLAEPHGKDLPRSCSTLCAALALAFEREDIHFDLSIPSQPIDCGTARGLMLLLAELVTNAVKHSRRDRRLVIAIELLIGRGGYDLIVRNSGKWTGDLAKPPRVASQLAARFGGVLTVDTHDGYAVHATIPLMSG